MKTISIDSEKYVKATDIARELGYTADYVGQLCRAEKVDAQLVGRSWYVSEDSIRAHKQTRYRSTKKASKETIAQTLKAKDLDSQDSFAVPVSIEKRKNETHYAGQHFYTRAPVATASNYFTDETELIAEGNTKNKTGRLSVSLADAHSVAIASKSKEYDFNPTPRQEIRFAGSLSVSEIEDTSMDDEEEPSTDENVVDSHIKQVPDRPSARKPKIPETDGITNKIKVKHLRKSKKRSKKNLPVEHNLTGVVGMQRARISDRNPVGGTLKVAVLSDNATASGAGVYFILVSVFLAMLISVTLMSMQASIHFEGAVLVTSYTLDFSTLLAAVYSAW